MTATTVVTSCPPAPPALRYRRDPPTAHPLLGCTHPPQRNVFTQVLKNAWWGRPRHSSQGSNPEISWDSSYPDSKCWPWIFTVIEAHQAEVDCPDQVPVMRRHDLGPWETAPSAQQLVQENPFRRLWNSPPVLLPEKLFQHTPKSHISHQLWSSK